MRRRRLHRDQRACDHHKRHIYRYVPTTGCTQHTIAHMCIQHVHVRDACACSCTETPAQCHLLRAGNAASDAPSVEGAGGGLFLRAPQQKPTVPAPVLITNCSFIQNSARVSCTWCAHANCAWAALVPVLGLCAHICMQCRVPVPCARSWALASWP